MIRLSARQHAARTFIEAYTALHGTPPTLVEIGQHLGVCKERARQIRVQLEIRLRIQHRQYAQRPRLERDDAP